MLLLLWLVGCACGLANGTACAAETPSGLVHGAFLGTDDGKCVCVPYKAP